MSRIPRTFCITLKETPARTNGFIENAETAGLSYEFFYGVLGSRMGLSSIHPNDIECPDKNIYLTKGAVGCYLSHFTLWNVLQYLPEDEFLIMEDDVVFDDGFKEKFDACYSRLPSNWDMVYVGWIPNSDSPTPIIVDAGLSIRIPSATQAYIIKKSLLKRAIEIIQPCQSPIDLVIAKKLLPTIKYYVFDPPLISQRSYLNISDSVWTSLVYDWDNDLYGMRRKILQDISFGDGWYFLEKLGDKKWKWSNGDFEIYVPNFIDSIKITVSSTKTNTLTIKTTEKNMEYSIISGKNDLYIPCKNQTVIYGKLSDVFIPSKEISGSQDRRTLGICLSEFSVVMGTTEISIPIEKI
jgi:GR25 family glycosyltransferase involved in LPS biosynthesis